MTSDDSSYDHAGEDRPWTELLCYQQPGHQSIDPHQQPGRHSLRTNAVRACADRKCGNTEAMNAAQTTTTSENREASSPPLHDIFLSHAGEQKQSLVWFTYEALRTRANRSPFFDRVSLQAGGHGHEDMDRAMQTCSVGLFVLSPEFVAKKYPMRELEVFLLRRRDEPLESAPKIIPIFFELSLDDCDLPEEVFFSKFRDVFSKPEYEFEKRVADGEISRARVMEMLKEIKQYSGIINKEGPYQIVQDTVKVLRVEPRLGTLPSTTGDSSLPTLDYAARHVSACRSAVHELEQTLPKLPLLNRQLGKKANDLKRAIRDLDSDVNAMQQEIDECTTENMILDGVHFHHRCDDLTRRWMNVAQYLTRFRHYCEIVQQREWTKGVQKDEDFLQVLFDAHHGFLTQLRIDGLHRNFAKGTRERVFKHLEEWLANPTQFGEPSMGLVLASTAGMGKSAIAAQVVKRYGERVIAKHFCRHDKPEQSNDRLVVLSIAGQVTEQLGLLYPMYKDLLAHDLKQMSSDGNVLRSKFLHGTDVDAGAVLEDVLLNPLKELMNYQPGVKKELGKFFIVIDALDEANPDLIRCVRNHFIQLPFKIFVTSRPETLILSVDKVFEHDTSNSHQVQEKIIGGLLRGFNPVTIDKDMLDNIKDLQIALRQSRVLCRIEDSTFREEVISSIIEKGEANFEYARMLEDAIESTLERNQEIDIRTFPHGISESHSKKFAEIFRDTHFRASKEWKAITCMAAAAEPLPVPLLQRLLQIDKMGDILNKIKGLFHVRNQHIQFFHKSVMDFVTDQKVGQKAANSRFYISKAAATNVLARECWRVLMESRNEIWQLSDQDHALTDKYLVLNYLKKHAVRHVLDSSLLDSSDQVNARKTEFEVFEFLMDASILWERARSMDNLLKLSMEYVDFGTRVNSSSPRRRKIRCRQGYGVDKNERRFMELIGRALRGAQPRCRASSMEELPGQLVGRLLGPSQLNGGEEKHVQDYICNMLLKWKNINFGFPWWCPKNAIWEWANYPCMLSMVGHSGTVNDVAISPDGRKIASGADDCTVRIWNLSTGETMQILRGHTIDTVSRSWSSDGTEVASTPEETAHKDVTSVSWSPDGTKVALASEDKTLRIWIVATGEATHILQGHKGIVNSVSWSPDGRKVASGSDDKTVRVWDTMTGENSHVFKGHSDFVVTVAWSPKGDQVASGSFKTVRLWKSGEVEQLLEGHLHWVTSVSWSCDGTRVASASRDRTIRIWNVRTCKPIHVLKGHEKSVFSVCWSPYENKVASGSRDGTVRLWNASRGETTQVLQGHTWMKSVSWSPTDASLIASGSKDATVRLWNTMSSGTTHDPLGHTREINSLSWSPDGKQVASGANDKTVCIWKTTKGELFRVLRGHTGAVKSVAWSGDGRRLASGSSDKTIRLWNAETGDLHQVLNGDIGWVRSVCWSPAGNQVASGEGKTVCIWNTTTGRRTHTLYGHTGSVHSVSWSPTGTHVASGAADKTVHIWNARMMPCSPDGSSATTETTDTTGHIWNAMTGLTENDLRSHSTSSSLDDGSQVASGDEGSSLSSAIHALTGHTDEVTSVAWSSDGDQVASLSCDNTICISNAISGETTRVLANSEFSNAGEVFETVCPVREAYGFVVGVDCQQFSSCGCHAVGVYKNYNVVFFELIQSPP